jgi:Tol biopolymer transport system component
MSEENDRLNSWKAIAAYLNRTVRTVQRWEREEGLPVRRHGHARSHSVFAYKAELDAWLESRQRQASEGVAPPEHVPAAQATPSGASGGPDSSPSSWRRPAWGLGVMVVIAVALAGLWFLRTGPAVEATHHQSLEAVPFTTFPGSESDPALSPDGERVAFAWDGENQNNFDIYVKTVGTQSVVRFTSDPAVERCPAWSPQGDQIAFARTCLPGVAEIYVAPVSGGAPRKIAETRAPGCGIAWSPDGQWLAAPDRESDRDPLTLYLISLATGEKRRLSSLELPHFTQTSAFSPSGRILAFPVLISGGSSDLFLIEFDSAFRPAAQPRRLTFTRAKTGNPIWLAGGTHLIFTSGQWGGVSYLWEIATTGRPGEPQRLTSLGDDVDQAAYAPAANRLVCRRRYEDVNIWRLDLAGEGVAAGAPVRLLASTRIDYNPQISPEGKRIAFHSTRSGQAEIWVADADGSNALQLTSMGAPVTGSPRWSPDGAFIAFDSNAAGNYDVYVVEASGGSPRRLTDDPADDGVPSWSRDGRWIYFVSNRSGQLQIWKMPSGGGPAIQITRAGGYVGFESADGRFLYYQKGPPASPILKVPVEGGAETEVGPPAAWMGFAVTAQGIYYIPAAAEGIPSTIEFLSFASGRPRQVAQLSRPPGLGLSVSADGRWLLYSQVDHRESDLMLVENFR